MSLFRRRKEPKVNPKEAMNKLRETSDLLEKREKYLESKIDAELKFAKLNASKNKRAALMALKRKKTWENEVLKLGNTRETIEAQLNAIEGVTINIEVMNAMKAGGQAMKTIHGDLNIDKVDNIMDDIREGMDLANEVWDAISQPQFGTEHDEDELAQELDALEQEALDEHFMAVPSVALPGVPTGVPDIAQPSKPVRVQAEEEDEELNQFKMQMAI